MSFSKVIQEDRRLVLLRLLYESSAYSAHDHLLHAGLDSMGHNIGMDTLRTDTHWLQEQGLVKIKEISDDLSLVSLTQRGADVARGHAVVPGVKRPGPADWS